VYEFRFKRFSHIAYKRRQSPLTVSSSQLRSEALPRFYNCVTFEWQVVARASSGCLLHFTDYSHALTKMPVQYHSRVKTFDFMFRYGFKGRSLRATRLLDLKFQGQSWSKLPFAIRIPHSDRLEELVKKGIDSIKRGIRHHKVDWTLQQEPLRLLLRLALQ
jgi:hypothetical protein